MNKLEKLKELKGWDNHAIHTPTREEYHELMGIYDENGWVWCIGDKPKDLYVWESYDNETCISFKDRFEYSELNIYQTYEDYKRTIIPFQEFKEAYLSLDGKVTDKPKEHISILLDAERIINGERQADYDDPVENFNRISKIASIFAGKELTAIDCCKVMIAVKIAREGNKHKDDNLIDLCGYAEILNRLNK